MKFLKGLFLLITFTAFSFSFLQAQQAREVFGKNRIQYRQFDWVYLSGENFDVYYYDGRKTVATQALEYLESEFDRITDLIGYPPYFKTKVFLYNSLTDLRQSNVGLNHTYFNVGGETEFIKPYVEVAYLGTAQEFKEELLFKISDLMLNEMMFGGNLKDMFQSSILMNLPEWFVNGASRYVAKGWDTEMDDYMRQLIRTRKAKRATRLEGNDAALVGQSIWNFIAEKYGKSSVANILNYTRVTRNEEKSVSITLGISFRQLLNEWYRYYGEMQKTNSQSYIFPSDSVRFAHPANKTTVYTTVKISPDGEYVAYAQNDRGNFNVKVRSVKTGRERIILSGGSKVINQRVDYRLPIISWSDINTLGVIGVKDGGYVFWLYDLSTKTKIPRPLEKFSNVRSMEFSGNGRLVVLSADFEGKSDLFLLSTRRDRVRRLTNDMFDDLDPTFIPGTNRIVFSSNRINDTLRANVQPTFEKISDNYNLFLYDLDSTNLMVKRLTNTLSKDYSPMAIDESNFIYLSDQRGIVNLFKFNSETGIYSQLTNYATGIDNYDYNASRNLFSYVMTKNFRQNIFVEHDFNLSRQIFTPATRRKELQQARVIRERRKTEENKTMSIKDLLNARLREAQQNQQDTSRITPPTQVPKDSVAADSTVTQKPAEEPKRNGEVVNTDNYVFEDEAVRQQQQPTESFLTRYMKARDKSRITGPFDYETKFSYNNLVTSMVIDPLRGLGISIETQMNDMLESYRFYGGVMSSIDLRNGDAYAEFQYLPNLIDFSVRFDRKGIKWVADPASTRDQEQVYHYALNRFEVGASLPLTDRLRITLKPFGAVNQVAELGERDFPLSSRRRRPSADVYAGIKSEIVYDNSVNNGLNLIEGTRGKLVFQHYEGLENGELSFSQASVDVRHYQKVYKEIVFAVRGFAGTFFGNSPKLYLLGGMDNWAFNKERTGGETSTGEPNPLGNPRATPDLVFAEFATSLRGYDYATLFGNSVILANAEFRLPLIKALVNGPISSNFLRNMQFIAFYDIGTSWSGKPPFSQENSVSNETIGGYPSKFDIKIENYINPWLYSYGVGMRTVILGYYMKFDLAWPVENYEVLKPKFHFTLGFDF